MSIAVELGELKSKGGELSRQDYFCCDPAEIVIDERMRGRHIPPTNSQIMERAYSIFKNGQRVPAEGRRIEKNRVQLVSGFTRHAAVQLIRHGFTYRTESGETEKIHDPKFLFKVIVSDCNEEEAFKRNLVENAERNATSPVDDAHNHAILRDRYAMSNADIGRFLQLTQGYVGECAKLLKLSKKHQMLVHDGRLSVSAALAALELPEEARAEAIESNVNDSTGKVAGGALKDSVRDRILSGKDATKDAGDCAKSEDERGKVKRGMKHVKAMLRQMQEEAKTSDAWPEEIKAQRISFLSTFSAWIDGARTDDKLIEKWNMVGFKE